MLKMVMSVVAGFVATFELAHAVSKPAAIMRLVIFNFCIVIFKIQKKKPATRKLVAGFKLSRLVVKMKFHNFTTPD